jgi:hypothetical protein
VSTGDNGETLAVVYALQEERYPGYVEELTRSAERVGVKITPDEVTTSSIASLERWAYPVVLGAMLVSMLTLVAFTEGKIEIWSILTIIILGVGWLFWVS